MAKKEKKKSLVQWADGSRDAYVERYQEVPAKSCQTFMHDACGVEGTGSEDASRLESVTGNNQLADEPHDVAVEGTAPHPLYFPPAETPSSAREVLDEAVAKLSPQQNKVWQLCMVMGKTVRDAAVVLKLGASTVQDYLETARKHVIHYCQANQYRVA